MAVLPTSKERVESYDNRWTTARDGSVSVSPLLAASSTVVPAHMCSPALCANRSQGLITQPEEDHLSYP
ncbi:hypothetical protein Pmani_001191 [Petrolisthes manimaculis]|uniref:Uncharacterized protein n=1 Tax=Petrolisthes manimaculis TaxID=1843537 RepID=A0AAE1QK69_9EUCA|nr:hypothetical protein Pmani_001191 [Petrolisthes manimaculis]